MNINRCLHHKHRYTKEHRLRGRELWKKSVFFLKLIQIKQNNREVIARTQVYSAHLLFLVIHVNCFGQISLQVVCPGEFSYFIYNTTTLAVFFCFVFTGRSKKYVANKISRELKCLHAFIKFVKLAKILHMGSFLGVLTELP